MTLGLLFIISILLVFGTTLDLERRNLRRQHLREINEFEKKNEAALKGTYFIPNSSTLIYSAIIVAYNPMHVNQGTLDNTPNAQNITDEIARVRFEHVKTFIEQIPWSVSEWPGIITFNLQCRCRISTIEHYIGIFTQPCPYNHWQRTTERGLSLAHFQIWSDFVHFDPEAQPLWMPNGTPIFETGNYCSSVPHAVQIVVCHNLHSQTLCHNHRQATTIKTFKPKLFKNTKFLTKPIQHSHIHHPPTFSFMPLPTLQFPAKMVS